MNLGNLYREEKQLDLAEHHLRRSIAILYAAEEVAIQSKFFFHICLFFCLREEFPTAWMNLGIVLASQGKFDEALLSYSRALKYRRNYATCYYNIGNLVNQCKSLKSM